MRLGRRPSLLMILSFLVGALPTGEFSAQAAEASTGLFNVKDYGAKGDGKTLDTGALNKAIEASAAAGGGTVYFPAGTYVSARIHLKSNVTLWIDSGATILGSGNPADFPSNPNPVGDFGRFGGLIEGENVERVGIIGNGVIDAHNVRSRGPHTIYLPNAREFTLRDFTIKDSSNFAFYIVGSEHGTIEGIKVYGGADGIHMQSTRDVTISNCRLYTGDDSLAGHGWQNVSVTNCILSSACHPMRLGGENVVFNGILILGPSPYPLGSTDRYNTMSAIIHFGDRPPVQGAPPANDLFRQRPSDNMVFNGLTMINVRSPMYMAPGPCCRWPEGLPGPGLKKIFINNLTAIGAGKLPIAVVGTPAQDRVESVVLNNVRLTYDGGIQQADGYSVDPSSGFYFENVERVELNNVHVDFKEKDARPLLMAKNVATLVLNRLESAQAPENFPLYVMDRVGAIVIDGKPAPASAGQIQGLELDFHRTGGKAIVGEPFNAVVTVQNTGTEGLAEVRLRFGQDSLAKSVWLKAKEKRQVLFTDLKYSKPGEYRIGAGQFQKTVTAAELPPQEPIAAPYQTFSNVTSETYRRGDVITLLTTRAGPGGQAGRKDSYASVYLKQALHQNQAITVRVDRPNPDMSVSTGAAGIMVRNDMSKPGESAGYVTVQSSLHWGLDREWSWGYAMYWDADGNGETEHHTLLDGYTQWPHWLKLERHGSKYTGYFSLDGKKWDKLAEVEVPGGNEAEDAGIFASQAGGRFQEMKVADLSKP